jgi:hypothetical protein
MDEQTEQHARKIIEGWAWTATYGLCAEAKERIRLELTAHFIDAVEEEISTGASSVQAFQKIYLALGSPLDAQRSFKRTYLTEGDKSKLENLRKNDPINWSQWVWRGVLVLLYASWFTFVTKDLVLSWTSLKYLKNISWFLLLFSLLDSSRIMSLIFRRFGPRITIIVLMPLVFFFILLLYLLTPSKFIDMIWFYPIFGGASALYIMLRYMPVLTKLSRNPIPENE